MTDTVRRLRTEPPHVIVGTAGRVANLLDSGSITARSLRVFAIDSADGFIIQGMRDSLHNLLAIQPAPPEILLSASETPRPLQQEVEQLRGVCVHCEGAILPLSSTSHFSCTPADDESPLALLTRILPLFARWPVVIFTNTESSLLQLSTNLALFHIPCVPLLPNLRSVSHRHALKDLECGSGRVVMVCDGSEHSGVDLSGMQVVIMYELPSTPALFLDRLQPPPSSSLLRVVISFASSSTDPRLADIANTSLFPSTPLSSDTQHFLLLPSLSSYLKHSTLTPLHFIYAMSVF